MRHAPPTGRTRTPGRPRAQGRSLGRSLKALLLAGVTACACMPAIAHAQAFGLGAQSKPNTPLADDGLGPRDSYMEADTMIDDRASQTVTARGHVEARTQGRTIRADELIFHRQTGAAEARGHAMLINADGTVQYGEQIEIDEQMRAGFATAFAARLQENVTVAAGAAVRRSETVQQLNQAIYTPCNICQADGVTPKTPTWWIQADRIIEDKTHNVVYYRNAIMRIKGIPVFYTPIFWTPDPTSPRRSGFLIPRIDLSKRRGFSYEQPYYWVISPYSDLTISPQVSARVNPLLNLEGRKRFYSGAIDIRAGVTYEENFTSKLFYDNATPRSYVLGQGRFNIDKNWIWGFGLERVTDPTFFRRYAIPDVFVDRGPFPTDTDRLISQIYTQRQDRTTFASIAALSFQTIRVTGQDTDTGTIRGESSRYFPFVAPLIEARYNRQEPVFGGRLRAQFNAVSLNRNNAATSLVDPSNTLLPAGPLGDPKLIPGLAPTALTTPGGILSWTDSRRATAQVDWRRAFTVGPGVRIDPFAQGRGDVYLIGNSSAKGGKDDFVTRLLGTVGADVSWPLYRNFKRTSVVVEPIAQLALSPLLKPSKRIPNEDSVSLTFDETNLFSANRFSGFDLYEGGARLNAGIRANAWFPESRTASLLIGRTFRTEPNLLFTPESGLRNTASDWIVAARVQPIKGLNLFSRSLIAADTGELRRQEGGIEVYYGWIQGGARYNRQETGLVLTPAGTLGLGRVQTLDFNGQVRFLKNYGVYANANWDIQADVWTRRQVGLFYNDECLRVDFIYTHEEYVGRIDRADGFAIRLTLATLGDTTRRTVTQGSR